MIEKPSALETPQSGEQKQESYHPLTGAIEALLGLTPSESSPKIQKLTEFLSDSENGGSLIFSM